METTQWLISSLILNKSADTPIKMQKSNNQESESPNKTIYMSKSKAYLIKYLDGTKYKTWGVNDDEKHAENKKKPNPYQLHHPRPRKTTQNRRYRGFNNNSNFSYQK